MIIKIITPQFTVEHQIAWLELSTPAGNFTVYRGHAPSIVPVSPGTTLVFKLKTGKQQTFTVQEGVVHITREQIEALITLAS